MSYQVRHVMPREECDGLAAAKKAENPHEVRETFTQLMSDITHMIWRNEFHVRDSGSAHLCGVTF